MSILTDKLNQMYPGMDFVCERMFNINADALANKKYISSMDIMNLFSSLNAYSGFDTPVYIDAYGDLTSAGDPVHACYIFRNRTTIDRVIVISTDHLTKKDLTFGEAIRYAKLGYRIARESWPVEKFVVYQKGYPDGIPCNKQTAEAWDMAEGDLFRCEPYLQISTESGSHEMWSPSSADCLAEDWLVVEC